MYDTVRNFYTILSSAPLMKYPDAHCGTIKTTENQLLCHHEKRNTREHTSDNNHNKQHNMANDFTNDNMNNNSMKRQ